MGKKWSPHHSRYVHEGKEDISCPCWEYNVRRPACALSPWWPNYRALLTYAEYSSQCNPNTFLPVFEMGDLHGRLNKKFRLHLGNWNKLTVKHMHIQVYYPTAV